MSLYRYVYVPYHALKHMAIDMPSLLKQAAGLRPVGAADVWWLHPDCFSRLVD
ncbi:MAG: hypothetical protein ACYC1M_10980 [Armatimonadota bacterium]